MLDIKFIRDNAVLVEQKSRDKGYPVNIAEVLELDKKYRALLDSVEVLRRERNELADTAKKTVPTEETISRGREIKAALSTLEPELKEAEERFFAALKQIPNMPLEDVPLGHSDTDNVVTKEVGIKPEFSFSPKNHWQIGESRGWIDKERAAKVTGARFAYLKGDLVLLELALIRYAMDQLTNEDVLKGIIRENNLSVSSKPFVPVFPPYLIRTDMFDAMDRLEPRDDRYKIEGEELWLQGSAEHVLGSMHANEIINEEDFPLRYVGFATSFRKEAGTYGKDMEGIFRLHQFNKLEMETFTLPEAGLNEHLFMVAVQEYLVSQLELPYRVLMKCTADIGKPNARGVDIDTWLPGQHKYRETHTADYMTDYQSRRLNIRVRRGDGSVNLVHTNDATALSERPLIAILENNQKEDGTIIVPKVLRPYMGGREVV